MARRLVMGQLRVQKVRHRDGRISYTVLEPGGGVHRAADPYLDQYAGAGTDKTYAYLLVDHLRWLEHEGLAPETVEFRDLQRYMGAAGAWDNGKADLYAEANRLGGLFPFMGAPREGRSRNPVGVMVDPALFLVDAEFEHDLPWKPICNPRVRLKGCAKQLDLASAHLCHFDPDMRATEARRITTLADHGRSALVGMDANSYPHQTDRETVALPDWEQVEDPVHYQHRTIERDGRRVSDTRPDEILSGGKPVFVDLGLHAATVLGQPGALAATASLKRTDQGPAQRIDRMYATPNLIPALIHFDVVATDEVREVSDHALLVARFDLAALRRILTPTR